VQPGSFYSSIFVTLFLVLALLAAVWIKRRRKGKQASARLTCSQLPLYFLRLAGFTLLAMLVVWGGMLLYVDYITVRDEVAPVPSQVEIPDDLPFKVEEVVFEGGEGLKLHGWFVPSQNDVTIIMLHGYGSNRTMMLWHAEQLIDAGYGVLMYDERASGESEGKRRSHGWEDVPDFGGAIDYLKTRPDVDASKIGAGGCSMGAMIALHGAAEYADIRAIWADGAGGMRVQDQPPVNSPMMLLIKASNYVIDWLYLNWQGFEPIQPTTEILERIAPRPIMFVAGGAPHPLYGSEVYPMEHLATFAGENAAIWTIPDAGHCGGPGVRPDEYRQRMVAFFDAAFGIER
jgi:pimeloyl-ACP methyl ester carboxylesterase